MTEHSFDKAETAIDNSSERVMSAEEAYSDDAVSAKEVLNAISGKKQTSPKVEVFKEVKSRNKDSENLLELYPKESP